MQPSACREAGGRIYEAKDGSSVGRLPAVRDHAYDTDLARRWSSGLRAQA